MAYPTVRNKMIPVGDYLSNSLSRTFLFVCFISLLLLAFHFIGKRADYKKAVSEHNQIVEISTEMKKSLADSGTRQSGMNRLGLPVMPSDEPLKGANIFYDLDGRMHQSGLLRLIADAVTSMRPDDSSAATICIQDIIWRRTSSQSSRGKTDAKVIERRFPIPTLETVGDIKTRFHSLLFLSVVDVTVDDLAFKNVNPRSPDALPISVRTSDCEDSDVQTVLFVEYTEEFHSLPVPTFTTVLGPDLRSIFPTAISLEFENRRLRTQFDEMASNMRIPLKAGRPMLLTIPGLLESLANKVDSPPSFETLFPDWSEATKGLDFLSLSATGELLEARAQEEFEQTYSLQGIPIPYSVLSLFVLGILLASLVWFWVHLRFALSAERAEPPGPFLALMDDLAFAATVIFGLTVLPITAASLHWAPHFDKWRKGAMSQASYICTFELVAIIFVSVVICITFAANRQLFGSEKRPIKKRVTPKAKK